MCSNVCQGNILGRGNSPGYEVIMAWLWPRLDGCISGFEGGVNGAVFRGSQNFVTWAAWEAREEQVFIQARSLATWSAVLGVYLVMSGVHTAGLTGAPAPQPAMLGVLGVVAPRSGLMFAV